MFQYRETGKPALGAAHVAPKNGEQMIHYCLSRKTLLACFALWISCASHGQNQVQVVPATGTKVPDSGNISIKVGGEKANSATTVQDVTPVPGARDSVPDQRGLSIGRKDFPMVPGRPEAAAKISKPTATAVSTKPAAASSSTKIEYLADPIVAATSATVERGGLKLPTRPEMLPEKPINLTVPDVFQTTLTNGIRFYYYESRDLPRVIVKVYLTPGSLAEPGDKVGLADLTARLIRTGGAEGMSGDDIDRELAQLGSDFSFASNREFAGGTLYLSLIHI